MSTLSFESVKGAVLEAGFEVFRAKGDTIQLAERVRSHLMDASVSVRVSDTATVSFIVRSQQVDFPGAHADELFAKIRAAVGDNARLAGFSESSAASRELLDPGDATSILDLWHELTYAKQTHDLTTLVADLQWALGQPKCVGP